MERYFLLWNWRRFVFNLNVISLPITMYSTIIQSQENLVPESNSETPSPLFSLIRVELELQKEREMKPSPAFWCNCIFKITLQPLMFKDCDSKPRIYNDLTYIAGKYDFPLPVAQILLYVSLPLVQVTRIYFLYKFPYITIIAALCLIVTCFVFHSHFITACLKPINIQVSTLKWNYKFQFGENKPLFRLISFK